LTDRVAEPEGRGGRRPTKNITFNVISKDVDGLKASQTQITAQAHHAQESGREEK